MKATIENLKENRGVIIETLNSLFGEAVLVSKMNILKDKVEYAEMFDQNQTIEDIIEEMRIDTPSRRKISKTAEILSGLAFNRGEEWDNKKQKFVKF